MEPRALQYPSPPWDGPRQSSFSPLWEQSYQPVVLAPCPDLVRSRCQHPGAARHSEGPGAGRQAPGSSGIAAADASASGLRGGGGGGGEEREEAEPPPGDGRGAMMLACSRGRSFSAASASNPATPRRWRDEEAAQQPGSPDWLTAGGGGDDDSSPEAACRSRSRSIILRKSKRRPDPPQRSVSLRRDAAAAAAQDRDAKTRSLFLPNDAPPPDPAHARARPPAHTHTFLPDLILISKPRAEEEGEEPEGLPVSPAQAPPELSVSGGNPGQQCEATDPYCTMLPGRGAPRGPKAPGGGRSESGRPPLPPRGPLPQIPPVASQSSSQPAPPPSPGAGSPPLTPTGAITGPSPLGCRMRPRPSPTSPHGRTSRLRLSLELPASSTPAPPTHSPAPAPGPALRPKAMRRHSDSSAFCQARGRRLSASVTVMPVVTQEELSSVRLRPLSSSDACYAHEPPDDVAAGEGPEGEACPPPAPPQGPKARPPPVAAKPPVPRWLPGHMAETETLGLGQGQGQGSDQGQGQGEVTYTKVRRPKPKRSHHHAAANDDVMQRRPDWPRGHVIDASPTPSSSQSETRGGVVNSPIRVAECDQVELQRKRRVTPPPVARKPDVILRPSTNNHLTTADTGLCLEDRGGERSSVSQMTRLCLGEQDLSPPRTEDLFTIIHRSKKKLLSGRESADTSGSRQAFGSPTKGGCDPHPQGQGVGGERSSSKTDSFMAFLQRRRSQKPSARERVSAAELLKTSKHLTNHSTEQAQP